MDSFLEQNSQSRLLLMGLKRKGAPQPLHVKLIDLNFKIVNYFSAYLFGSGGGTAEK